MAYSGALAARPAAGAQPQLRELRGRPLVPAEGLCVAVEVLQQVVLDQLGDLRQPHQVGRVRPASTRGAFWVITANWSSRMSHVTFGCCLVNSVVSALGSGKPVSK